MKKVLIGCFAAIVVVGGIGAILLVLAWNSLMAEQPKLEGTLAAPGQVAPNATVTMVVKVTNPHAEPIILDSIDIDEAFLAGFQVVSVDPEPTNTATLPILDQRTWAFGTEVAAGASIDVTYEMKAIQQGRFTGSVDICNPNQDFTSLFADIVVQEGAAEE